MNDKLLQKGINLYKLVNRYHTFLPRQVKVEITRACNLHCVGCRRNFPESIANAPGPKHLTLDMLKDIIKDLPIKIVRFTGDGEPFCNPNFGHILAYLASMGIRSAITTNATWINRNWIEALEDSKVFRISVSFDGAVKETFEALRGGAKFEQVVEACKLIGKSKIQLYMNCLLSTDEVIEQLPKYVGLAKEVGATGIHIMKYQSQEEDTWNPPDLSKHGDMLEWVNLKARQVGLIVSAPYTTDPSFRECEDPFIAPWVALTGEVFPCVYMANMREYEVYQGEKIVVPWRNYVMGNINETPLRDIWKNEAFKELRQHLKIDRKFCSGGAVTPQDLLEEKKSEGPDRFHFCTGCSCQWGESGI